MPQQALNQIPRVKTHITPCIINLDSEEDESSPATTSQTKQQQEQAKMPLRKQGRTAPLGKRKVAAAKRKAPLKKGASTSPPSKLRVVPLKALKEAAASSSPSKVAKARGMPLKEAPSSSSPPPSKRRLMSLSEDDALTADEGEEGLSSVQEVSSQSEEEQEVIAVKGKVPFRRTTSLAVPAPVATSSSASASPASLSTVRIFDHDLSYRSLGSIVLFKSDELFELIQSVLPLAMDLTKAGSGGGLKMTSCESRIHEEVQKKEFISWNALKPLLSDAIFDQALRDLLNSYAVADDSSSTQDAFSGKLERDHVKLETMDVSFIVSKGKVFLDILGSFTILGELKLAMRNHWERVDQILERCNLKRKEAFRRCHKSSGSSIGSAGGAGPGSRGFASQRSHISFKALRALAEHGLVADRTKRQKLSRAFSDLQDQIDALTAKKDQLFNEIRMTAEMIMRTGRFLSRRSYSESSSCTEGGGSDFEPKVSLHLSADDSTEDEASASLPDPVNSGTELCDSSCGRQYHFTVRCCRQSHTVNLGGKDVSYVVSRAAHSAVGGGRIFLDKCSAFSALGRMYVIRCSDYRKSDRLLNRGGLLPSKHYLFEKRNYGQETPRNRRTHISLEAFMMLVRSGFADSVKSDELLVSVEEVREKTNDLKRACPNYTPERNTGSQDDDDDDDDNMSADSLECLESMDEEKEPEIMPPPPPPPKQRMSPATSPVKNEPQPAFAAANAANTANVQPVVSIKSEASASDAEPEGPPLPVCHLLGREVPYRVEHGGRVYLKLSLVCEFLSDEDRLVPRLKRRARSLDVEHPFFPPYFRRGTQQFISAECLLKMIENHQVTPGQREALKAGLVAAMTSLEDKREAGEEAEEGQQKAEASPSSSPPQHQAGSPAEVNSKDFDSGSDGSDCEVDAGDYDFNAPSGPFTAPELTEKSTVQVLDTSVPYQVVNNTLYLEKKSMFQLFALSSGPFYRTYRAMDRVLENAKLCLDDAFLYEGRKRGYISSGALKVLAGNDFIRDEERKAALVQRLDELEGEKEALKTNHTLELPSCHSVIAFKCFQGTVYLHTLQVLRAVGFSPIYLENSPSKAYFALSKLLTQRGLNLSSCFLKQGKSKYVYMSLHALLVLFETEFGAFKDKDKMAVLRGEILDLLKKQGLLHPSQHDPQGGKPQPGREGQGEARRTSKSIVLGGGFASLRYRIKEGRLFVHRRSCFETFGLEKVIMTCPRGYAPINDVLARAGMKLSDCYLPGKRERFAYIALRALLVLLESQDPLLICLEKKEKFSEALLTAIQSGAASAIVREDLSGAAAAVDSKEFVVKKLFLNNSSEKPVPFKLSGSRMYLLRHTAYTLAGLYEKAEHAHGDYDIFDEPTTPLSDRGLNAEDCFLADGGDPYAFISVDALLILMNLDGDIARAGDYQKIIWKNLLSAIGMEAPKLRVHVKMSEFRSALISTLLDKFLEFLEHVRSGLAGGSGSGSMGDAAGEEFVEIVDLVTETETEGEECPVLPPASEQKANMRLSTSSSASNASSSGSAASPFARERRNTFSSFSGDGEVEIPDPGPSRSLSDPTPMRSRTPSSSSHASSSSKSEDLADPLTLEEFESLRQLVATSSRGGMIGDWQVQTCDADAVRAVVNPGYGASKKMSFIHPDVSAVLSYTFVARPGAPPQLFINELAVSATLIRATYDKAKSQGLLNLLYNLLTLRPCFGSFNPELVETVEKGLVSEEWTHLRVDHAFIGSSQNGRNYAGTVRARSCKVLAASRVGDTCSECEVLKKVVINRSVLPSGGEGLAASAAPEVKSKKASSSSACTSSSSSNSPTSVMGVQQHHKSVWQMVSSSETGCTFVCPQLQSFNVSLPNQFRGHLQATAIMEHKVSISADLRATIWLNGRQIKRTFKDFEQSKQVGPLLEWVASLRLCIGYPDQQLVQQARYILEKKTVLQPEIRKFFDHIEVDEDFRGKMSMAADDGEFAGTVRTPTCRGVAGDHADICDQCRLLQEPIEFLGL